jgi:aminoglycoside 6-adenylyltransferase
LPQPPTAKQFADCCNEFWWVCPYVAKGLWRREIIYARFMLDQVVREQLEVMLVWHIGIHTQFARNPGYHGKYFENCLEPELWDALLQTYAAPGYAETWDALTAMCHLFSRVAVEVAGHFGFEYPQAYDERVSAHLVRVRGLPGDASEIA